MPDGNQPTATPVNWRIFLTDSPPGIRTHVVEVAAEMHNNGWPNARTPELQLHCDGVCQGSSFCSGRIRASGLLFAARRDMRPRPGGSSIEERYDLLLCYTCDKCLREVKAYAVRFCQRADPPAPDGVWGVEKMGEWPRFSPRTPSKLMSIVGPDCELFLKGRRAEIDGLGVGAFSYYRRIVEGQKSRLLDEIIRVAKRTSAPSEMVARLEAAKGETQFSKAVGGVREAFPPALLIKGHNPLTLLHTALSRGLHDSSDEECLQAAHDIRVVLVELAERLGRALDDEKELENSLNRLLNPGT